MHNLAYSGDWSYAWLNTCMTAAATGTGSERNMSLCRQAVPTNYYIALSILHKANIHAILTMLYISMTVSEPGHMAAVLSSVRYISRACLCSLLLQRNRFSFLIKLSRKGNSTKKQISSMLRTWRKKTPKLVLFCYARQVTSKESCANSNDLMRGVKLILMQLSSQRQNTTQSIW